MRLLIIAVALLSIGSIVSATYSTHVVENHLAHANHKSRIYALGDSGDASGWRDCIEMANTSTAIGVTCEGSRNISIHSGIFADVNYTCEFHFIKQEDGSYLVDTQSCQ